MSAVLFSSVCDRLCLRPYVLRRCLRGGRGRPACIYRVVSWCLGDATVRRAKPEQLAGRAAPAADQAGHGSGWDATPAPWAAWLVPHELWCAVKFSARPARPPSSLSSASSSTWSSYALAASNPRFDASVLLHCVAARSCIQNFLAQQTSPGAAGATSGVQ